MLVEEGPVRRGIRNDEQQDVDVAVASLQGETALLRLEVMKPRFELAACPPAVDRRQRRPKALITRDRDRDPRFATLRAAEAGAGTVGECEVGGVLTGSPSGYVLTMSLSPTAAAALDALSNVRPRISARSIRPNCARDIPAARAAVSYFDA